MARPQKIGVEYFPLDVDIDQDDKVAMIEALHGLIGFSIVIKLLMKIYKEGYYCEWTEREQILFSRRVSVDIKEVNAIINDCVKWGMFDEGTYTKHQILTSKGIQARYFEIVKRRKEVEVVDEFLLIGQNHLNNYKNIVTVDINGINVNINQVNDDISTQSKVKESKVNESILNKTTTEDYGDCSSSSSKDNGLDKNEELSRIAIAFQDNGFGSINITVKEMLLELLDLYSAEWIIEALKIAVESNKRSLRYVKGILENWQTSGGMVKKVDNTNKSIKSTPVKKTRFHNFEQRTDKYSSDEIEGIAARKRREYSERNKQSEAK